MNLLPAPDLLQHTLRNALPHFAQVQWCTQTTSTNTQLWQGAKNGTCALPALLGAHAQSAGRGRLSRSWQHRHHSTLMFSCAYPVRLPIAKLPPLAPLAGIVACEQLQAMLSAPLRSLLTMKWPNDIEYRGAKLSGLLVETLRPPNATPDDFVVIIGMGMNLHDATALSQQLGRPVADWTSVLQAVHRDVDDVSHDMGMVVARLAIAWEQAIALYSHSGFEPFVVRHQAVDALRNRLVDIIQDGQLLHQGRALGLDAQARLRLQLPSGQIIALHNGDVSVRSSTNPPPPAATL